jgi:hypothetical protein
MKHWHKSAPYREALKTLLIPIFLSPSKRWNGDPISTRRTHDVDSSNTVRLEQRREKRVQHGTQAPSRHAIAVNARGSASICSSVIPLGIQGRSPALQQQQVEAGLRAPGASLMLSYGALKLFPVWDPLRGDPRFEQIVAELAPKE